MSRYEDSMLVLRHTFPGALASMGTYSTSPHAKAAKAAPISELGAGAEAGG